MIKPELGKTVYCIYKEGIIVKTVEFLGAKSFINPDTTTYEDSWEWWYEDYGVNWFLDLGDAINALLKLGRTIYGDDAEFEIVQHMDDYYYLKVNGAVNYG